MKSFILGLDLGQANDWSALVALERTELEDAPATARWRYDIRHCDRVRRVPYDKIAERVRMLAESLEESATLVVDKTGVGAPVVDILERFGIRAALVPVTITGGDAPIQHGREWSVPKRDLATTVAVCLQTGRLRIGLEVPHAMTLMKEMQAFRVHISAAGHDTYEAWREKDHDDLVLATALAVWYGERGLGTWEPGTLSAGGGSRSQWGDVPANQFDGRLIL
jgi:hypothetical protein